MQNGAVWSEWNDHRLDWTPDLSAWYLNGELAETKTYGVPRSPSSVILNMVSLHRYTVLCLSNPGSGVMVACGRER